MTDDKAAERPDSGQPRLIADERANVTIVDGDEAFAPSDAEKDAARWFFAAREPGFYWTTNDDDPGFPKEDTLAVREWTGGSWMETGLQEPIDDQFVVVLSGRLGPPAE